MAAKRLQAVGARLSRQASWASGCASQRLQQAARCPQSQLGMALAVHTLRSSLLLWKLLSAVAPEQQNSPVEDSEDRVAFTSVLIQSCFSNTSTGRPSSSISAGDGACRSHFEIQPAALDAALSNGAWSKIMSSIRVWMRIISRTGHGIGPRQGKTC